MTSTTAAAFVNDTTLAFTSAGPADGVPVLLLHSLFKTREMMYPLLHRLAERGFRCVAYDHRGQGASARARRGDLHLDTLTADALALARELGMDRPHVVGNSLGGMVALRLAAGHPEKVRTVTAIGASAEAEYRRDEFDPLVDHLTRHGGNGGLDTEDGPRPVRDVLAHIMFGDHTLLRNTALVARWQAYFDQLDPSIGDAAYQVVARDSVRPALHDCEVPVLAIAGFQDHAYPQPISGQNIAEAVGANGYHVTVADAGHSPSLEQPAVVAEHLEKHFLHGEFAR